MSETALTLYAIADTLPALLDSFDMTDPDTPERAECEAEIRRYVEALPQKVDGIVQVRAHLKSQADLAAEEIKRLSIRKQVFQDRVKRLDEYCRAALERLPEPRSGNRRIEGATATLSLCKCPPSLKITDETAVPAEYRIVIPMTTMVDRKMVKESLQMGIAVPGAVLVTGKTRLGVS